MITFITLSIFSGIKGWIGGGLLATIFGLGVVKKWALIVDKVAKIGKRIAAKLKDLFGHVEETAQDIDDSIDDTTGKISLDKKDEIIQDVKDIAESVNDIADEFKRSADAKS